MRQRYPPPAPSKKTRQVLRPSQKRQQSHAARLTILCCVLSASSSPRPKTVLRRMALGFPFSKPALRCCWVPPSIALALILPHRCQGRLRVTRDVGLTRSPALARGACVWSPVVLRGQAHSPVSHKGSLDRQSDLSRCVSAASLREDHQA